MGFQPLIILFTKTRSSVIGKTVPQNSRLLGVTCRGKDTTTALVIAVYAMPLQHALHLWQNTMNLGPR